MKPKTLILLAFLAAWGCSSSSHEPVCGAGESHTSGGATYCFASSALVIETGFECPIEAPSRFEGPSGVVCAPAGVSAKDLPKELCTKAGDESCDELKLVGQVDATTPDASVSDASSSPHNDASARCTAPEELLFPGCTAPGEDEYIIDEAGECLERCDGDTCGDGRRCVQAALPTCDQPGDMCEACASYAGVCVDDVYELASGTIGSRCDVAGDCEAGLDCFKEFFGERGVCTKPCPNPTDCPLGTRCVEGIIDYNSQPLGPYCLLECSVAADCEPGGSECDTPVSESQRYCF